MRYDIFDMGSVEFDENRTIAELVSDVFAQYDYYEPMGMDAVTVYDLHTRQIQTDRTRTCKEAGLHRELCIAYYKPPYFYYVEGGWGHHMIQMHARADIPDAVSFQLRFEDFKGSPVINGNATLGQLFTFLKRCEYIDADCDTWTVSEHDEYYSVRRLNGTLQSRVYRLPEARHLRLKDLNLTGTVCVIG
jgi:hypothetical protein